MTTDVMNFRDFVEKAPDADLLREMIVFAAERLMELQVDAVTGAAYGEKGPARRSRRHAPPSRAVLQLNGQAVGRSRADDPDADRRLRLRHPV